MSGSDQPTGDLCGKWMPRKMTSCARGAGHPPPCATPEAMARQRQRAAERAPSRAVTPAAKARWNRVYKLKRYGLTPEQFAQMLEDQGYACAMGGEPLEDGQIFIDHDHACCPPSAARCCGKCVRGLLCLTCNVALGYIEAYSELAITYLETALRPASPQPAGRR
jgi:Recombination endonuclease VII